jgi:hypothetical protein
VTALLNLALSFVALKLQWLPGIAWATVVAQLVLGVAVFRFIGRQLEFSAKRRFVRGCAVPLICIAVVAWARFGWNPGDIPGRIALLALFGAAIAALAVVNGITPRFLAQEFRNIGNIFGRRR